MIAVTTDSLAAEERGELLALRHHFLWNAHLILGLGLSNHKLSDLIRWEDVLVNINQK